MAAAVVALAALAAVVAADARACSCAGGDPGRMLTQSDAAFVGTLVERRSPGLLRSTADPVTLVFEVERAVKGTLPERLELETAASGASCGIEAREGERIGLFLTREDDRWRSGLCQQIVPGRLLAAAAAGGSSSGTVVPSPPGNGGTPAWAVALSAGAAALLAAASVRRRRSRRRAADTVPPAAV